MAKRKPARLTVPGPAEPRTGSLTLAAAVIALVVLVLALYAPARHYPYVNWDDEEYVSGNAHVLAGLTPETMKWALTANTAGNWQPITMLSHAMDVELFGQGAPAQHVTNVVFHLANTLMIFGVLVSLTRARGRSFFVAALFAVHPIHVESVAWISERKDVLSTFFWLMSLWMYLRYVRRPRLAPYLLLLLFFALALMSKAMVVTLPLVLLLIDVWPLGRAGFGTGQADRWKHLVVEKIPLFALALVAGIVTLWFQARVGAVAGLATFDMATRLAGAVDAYVAYIGQTIWPANLSPFYPPHAIPLWVTIGEVIGLAAVTAAVIHARKRWPFLLVGWLWFVIILLPTIGIVKAGEQARADRYMYLPLAGLLLIVAWGVPELLKRWQRRTVLLPGLAIALVVAAGVTARAQLSHWSDSGGVMASRRCR